MFLAFGFSDVPRSLQYFNMKWNLFGGFSQDIGIDLGTANTLVHLKGKGSISDVGWRSFLGMLSYKADLYDRQFITVSPKNTTQTCHDCGFVMGSDGTKKLTLADREWVCPQCHVHHIRDYNAALNILEKGLQKQTIAFLI